MEASGAAPTEGYEALLCYRAGLRAADAYLMEKETLAALDHPFICGLRCAFQTEHHLCLALEYVEGGNMHSDLLYGPYSLPRTVFYAAQICLALDHIHSLDILYRDLKSVVTLHADQIFDSQQDSQYRPHPSVWNTDSRKEWRNPFKLRETTQF